MVAVHQLLPTFAPRDAIGTHARHVQTVLRDIGVESEIYAQGIARGVRRGSVHRLVDYRGGDRSTTLLYQLSTGSGVFDFVQGRPERTLVNYHNVTPSEFFRWWEPAVAIELSEGRRQLAELAPEVELGIAVSSYNAAELDAVGYRHTTVAPVLVDLDALAAEAERRTVDRLRTEKGCGTSWLFVGRIAPHKCQHELVRAFAIYRKAWDPQARLSIVGGIGSHAYWIALQRFIATAGLGDAVTLTGSVSDGDLAAHYATADAFVCLSAHEGFCVPLIEAMRQRLPVIAVAAAAVPETVGDAALLLRDRDPATVAAAVARVTHDVPLRAAMVAAGERRAAELAFPRSRARFVEVIEGFLSGDGPDCGGSQ